MWNKSLGGSGNTILFVKPENGRGGYVFRFGLLRSGLSIRNKDTGTTEKVAINLM